MGEQLPFAGGYGFGIDGAYDALAAKLIGGLGHHIGVGHGGRIEADLIGSSQQKRAYVLTAAHTAPDGQRDIALLGGAAHHVKHRAAVFMGGVDVEKAQFIRACCIIGPRRIHRITGIAQADKVHALDHAAIGDIKTGDDPGLKHSGPRALSPSQLHRRTAPGLK